MVRKCKKCGGQVEEDQALNTYEEFFDVYCVDCAARLRSEQEAPDPAKQAKQTPGQKPPGGPPEAPGGAQTYPWPVYRHTPGGPIFRIAEKAELPPGAIFHGYVRTGPKRTSPTYQLFKFPPKLDQAALDERARKALQGGGFNFEE